MKTILEIARENNVSKTAIVKRIERLGIKKKLTKQGNKYLISAKYETMIIEGLRDNTETNTETIQETDNPINALIQQLSEKDKQIEALHKMIIGLQDQITTQNNIIVGYRKLSIETKIEDKPKKLSFLERIGLRKKNSNTDQEQDTRV